MRFRTAFSSKRGRVACSEVDNGGVSNVDLSVYAGVDHSVRKVAMKQRLWVPVVVERARFGGPLAHYYGTNTALM